MGYQPKPPGHSPILLAKQTKWSPLAHCPKCAMDCTENHYCSSCNWMVHNRHGFDVATDHGRRVTLQEIRDFLHPPKAEPMTPGERIYVDYMAARIEDKSVVVGDDTTLLPGRGLLIQAPLPRSKPSGRLAKYEPRPLAHERKPSPWMWRTLYAVITMTAAALTLWQALRVG